ncbi:hypothetical protein [Actinoplanes sp. NBRC 103695]|uniref:hypothetical protein n=1 Tax=Actinoplanes sp. NBRC 103695 TaxID=3032202 RepID=UPI0024A156B9|nr:hypothetical protein [Actinoplanes sp. NBRC 103695]GLY94484.1 hypothetical protein Acsp02_17400 [Actinoplanes sp. NBRC 103695]
MKALKSALAVAGVTAAALFAFTAPAYAGGHGGGHDGGYSNGHGHDGDDDGFSQDSDDNYGFLNGTQVGIPIDLDLDISCNAIAILGAASSHCD